VNSFESIQLLSTTLEDDSRYAWIENMDTSEGKTESEKSGEQKEKIEFLGHFNTHSQLTLEQIGLARLTASQNINFSSSDHSQTIYSPPENFA
jgi:hypothetical protein